MTKQTIGTPEFTHSIGVYQFVWKDLGLTVNVERLDDDGIGELAFRHKNGTSDSQLLHRTKANLLSTTTMTQLAKRLKENADFDWTTILTYVTAMSLDALRAGTPLVNINEPPASMALDYMLYPILVKNEPTSLFAPGASAKSILADFIAIQVQFGVCGLDWTPEPADVLYLDWEASEEEHKRYITAIKKGLKVNDDTPILYRHCDRPLVNIVDTIRKDIVDYHVGLVILDSMMAATATSGHGQDASQIAGEYYNALHSFGCTTLTIDHVTKEGMTGFTENIAPYGSVVKYNRSRSQFEVKQQQEPGEDYMELALIHRKFNLGRRLKPLGIRVDFINDNDILKEVRFGKMNLADNPALAKNLSTTDKLIAQLRSGNKVVSDLVNLLDTKENNIYQALNRGLKKGLFIKLSDDSWGLKEYDR